jgi:tol-pal system protein YbgF
MRYLLLLLFIAPHLICAQEQQLPPQPRPPLENPHNSELPPASSSLLLENKVDRLDRAINSLERQLTAVNSVSNSSDQTTKANVLSFAQLEDLKEQVRQMRGDIERIQFENAKLNEKFNKLAADMELRFSELAKSSNEKKLDWPYENIDKKTVENAAPLKQEKAKEPVKKSEPEATAKDTKEKKDKTPSVEQQYQDAYALFKAKDYKGARESFTKFVEEHPDSEYNGNAYYWLGEISYLKGEYDKSAMYYLKGYQSNAKGSRAADNLLRLAKSLAKLEKRKEACTTYAKLKKEFPNANNNIKKQLEEESKELKCQL